jgi:para-nitrobenzyl esterase
MLLRGLAMLSWLPLAAWAGPTTRTDTGLVEGQRDGTVDRYLGIPFASPPTGENRWRAPRPAAAWSGTRDASRFGPSCPQALTPKGFGPWTPEYVIQGTVDEDCLTVNVWTPADRRGKRAVLVWIYGGGFNSGGSSVDIYDGRALSAQGIVVVSLNYRVGLHGFLSHPEAAGNAGLLDQVAALQWVQRNIAAFGGDPKQVTIAGQSAGAASVHHLIASPLAKGLFQRAIAQSGSGMGIPVADRTAAEASGVAYVSKLGARNLSELRAMSAADLEAADARLPRDGGPLRFAPAVDGTLLPSAAFIDANTNDVPLLTGMTSSEGTGLNPAYGRATPESFAAEVRKTYGPLAPALLAHYAVHDDATANAALDALGRERGLASMTLWARQRLARSRQPLYVYLWTHAEPGPESGRYKAFHSSEIPYVFGRLDAPGRVFSDADRALSRQVSAQWVRFVKTGNPNGPGLPRWPRYTKTGARLLGIDVETRPREALPGEILQLFERHAAAGGQLGIL